VERAAAAVQEWAIEEPWREGRSAIGPTCPDHRNSHPLELFVGGAENTGGENRAVWRCPRSSRVICALGKLPEPV
jgi:hypothetical protein